MFFPPVTTVFFSSSSFVVKSVCFCNFNHRENRHACIDAILGIAEEPCFPSQSYGENAVLCGLFKYQDMPQSGASVLSAMGEKLVYY